jgi:hypothetical protein
MIQKVSIEARIARIAYHHFPGSTTTAALVVLDNGFSTVGTSAAVDPAEFDASLGRKYAYADAIDKMFPHFACMALEAQRLDAA